MDQAVPGWYFSGMPSGRTACTSHLASIGIHRCERWWSLDERRTRTWTDLDLWLLLDGTGRVEAPDGVHDLAPGACLVMRGGEAYRFRADPGQRFRHWYAHFSIRDAAGRELPPSASPWPRFRQLDGHQLLADLLGRAAEAAAAGDSARDRWFATALLEVERADAVAGRPAMPNASAIDSLLARLREDPAVGGVAAMAQAAGLSADRFSRLFRARTGLSPRAHLVQLRLERARHLLADSTQSVAEIAAACGFADPSFFCRHFAAHHGISPGAWRRRRRTGGG